MKIISVNVGRPRLVISNGKTVSTAIFKTQVTGPTMLRTLNLDGDRQADLNVHGGPTKAAYAYPAEHYAFWREEFPEMQLPWGMFGENFTLEGLDESLVNIGDSFRIGDAEVTVTEPRMPCSKLGIRFGHPEILRRFLRSGKTGFYFSVKREGLVEEGAEIKLIERDPNEVTVADITRLYSSDKSDVELLRRAIALEGLPESWRARFRQQLAHLA